MNHLKTIRKAFLNFPPGWRFVKYVNKEFMRTGKIADLDRAFGRSMASLLVMSLVGLIFINSLTGQFLFCAAMLSFVVFIEVYTTERDRRMLEWLMESKAEAEQ